MKNWVGTGSKLLIQFGNSLTSQIIFLLELESISFLHVPFHPEVSTSEVLKGESIPPQTASLGYSSGIGEISF